MINYPDMEPYRACAEKRFPTAKQALKSNARTKHSFPLKQALGTLKNAVATKAEKNLLNVHLWCTVRMRHRLYRDQPPTRLRRNMTNVGNRL
jgi:hypothetical protein